MHTTVHPGGTRHHIQRRHVHSAGRFNLPVAGNLQRTARGYLLFSTSNEVAYGTKKTSANDSQQYLGGRV